MRAVSLLTLAAGLWLFATPAYALSISPNPVNLFRAPGEPGGSLDANLSALSVTGDTATFQLSVVTGSVGRLDVSMLVSSLTTPFPAFNAVAGASFAGSGIGGTASFVGSYASFVFSSAIGAGQTSQELVVTFASPIQDTWAGTVTFDNYGARQPSYTIVPEPLGLALAALCVAAIALRRRTA